MIDYRDAPLIQNQQKIGFVLRRKSKYYPFNEDQMFEIN